MATTPMAWPGFLFSSLGTEAAADLHRQFHLELLLLVERADVLVGIDQFDVLVELDVGGGDRRLPC